jgi:hypothetical protein
MEDKKKVVVRLVQDRYTIPHQPDLPAQFVGWRAFVDVGGNEGYYATSASVDFDIAVSKLKTTIKYLKDKKVLDSVPPVRIVKNRIPARRGRFH